MLTLMSTYRQHAQPDVRQLPGGYRACPGRRMEQGGRDCLEGPIQVN